MALHSYHMKGMAVDVALADRPPKSRNRCARRQLLRGERPCEPGKTLDIDFLRARGWRDAREFGVVQARAVVDEAASVRILLGAAGTKLAS